jgi:hypothetical protein
MLEGFLFVLSRAEAGQGWMSCQGGLRLGPVTAARQATGVVVATRGHGGMVHGEMGPLRSRREVGRRGQGQLLLAEEEEEDDDDDEEEDWKQWTGRKIPIQ